MKVMAINGSPRKEWNTGILLSKALEGQHQRAQKQR
jgi:multimeric flavodoxin WrbA